MENILYKKICLFLCLFLGSTFLSLSSRSPFRRLGHTLPCIRVHLESDHPLEYSEESFLQSIHLRPWPYLIAYDENFYTKRKFPFGSIVLRYTQECISGSLVRSYIAKAVDEIIHHCKGDELTYSIILKDSDFNYKYHAGLAVVRLKDFPFVLKIYRETPYTFCHPFSKGLVPILFFRTGNGANRHMSGLTRIPMRDSIRSLFDQYDEWRDRITIPRKWLWLPDNPEWLVIEGSITLAPFEVRIPALYVVVCDEIEIERSFSVLNPEDRAIAIELSNICGNELDANMPNFVVEKGTGKIAVIDTEYFKVMLGLSEPLYPSSYYGWIAGLAQHSIKRMFFTDKSLFLEECNSTLPPYESPYPES